jgi:hypothetical protein
LSDAKAITSSDSSKKKEDNINPIVLLKQKADTKDGVEYISVKDLKEVIENISPEIAKHALIPPFMIFSINDVNNFVGDLFSRIK